MYTNYPFHTNTHNHSVGRTNANVQLFGKLRSYPGIEVSDQQLGVPPAKRRLSHIKLVVMCVAMWETRRLATSEEKT